MGIAVRFTWNGVKSTACPEAGIQKRRVKAYGEVRARVVINRATIRNVRGCVESF
jgi:hypothetical protein